MKEIHNLTYVRNVSIILGRKCNGKCVYCAQSGLHVIRDRQFNPDVIEFVCKLTQFNRKDKNDRLQILLYGGEPLLYFSYIKEIIEGVVNSTETVQGTYYFKLFTNGSLLTEEIVSFFNKHNVKVVLGYDGPDESTRPVRLRDEQIPLFRRLNHKAVSFVLSSKNNNIIRCVSYIRNKFGKDISMDNFAFCSYYNGDTSIYSYCLNDFNVFYSNFLMFFSYYEDHPVDDLFWHLVRSLFRTNSLMEGKLDFLSVDISGNLFGFADKEDSFVCTIYEDGIDQILQYRLSAHSERCYKCAYNYYCRAYYGIKNEDGVDYNCKMVNAYVKALECFRWRIISILNKPENRRYLESLSSTWKIRFSKYFCNRKI